MFLANLNLAPHISGAGGAAETHEEPADSPDCPLPTS